MFEEYKVRKAFRKATKNIIFPIFDDNLSPNAVHRPIKMMAILKASGCIILATLIFVVFARGYHTRTLFEREGSSSVAVTENSQNRFYLLAYASEQNSVNKSSETTIQPNAEIKLPTGRITRDFSAPTFQVDGYTVYAYVFPKDSAFHLSGDNIKAIALKATRGDLTLLDSNNTEITHYVVGEVAVIGINDYVKWQYSKEDRKQIITNPNFTDFTSLPKSEIQIDMSFNDGTSQKYTVTIAFDKEGYEISELTEE